MTALEIAMNILRIAPGLSSLVGVRIYPVAAPQAVVLPYLLVMLISESDEQMLEGAGGYYEARISIHAVAKTATAADHIGEAVKALLEDLTNVAVTDGASPPEIIAVDVTFYKDGADFIDHSDDRSVFRRATDWRMRWRR